MRHDPPKIIRSARVESQSSGFDYAQTPGEKTERGDKVRTPTQHGHASRSERRPCRISVITMSVNAIGSPASINSTQRLAGRESRSFSTSIQTLVSTTITSVRDDCPQGCPPSEPVHADPGCRYVDGEQPTRAVPHQRLLASSLPRSALGPHAERHRRSRCSCALHHRVHIHRCTA
jgi:hypothetical protein